MNTCTVCSIEGSDGAGKATTTKLLIEYLIKQGKKVATLSFPRYQETTGGKILYEVLKSPRKEDYNFISLPPKLASLLYVIDRALSKPEIEQAIQDNDFLIFDRYVASNFIHQGGKVSNDAEREKLISFLSNLEYGEFGLPKPNITFFLHLPIEVAMKNKQVQRIQNQHVAMDAGEDDVVYLENSNKSGLWCVEHYGWQLIECFDEVHQTQKTREAVLEEIITFLEV